MFSWITCILILIGLRIFWWLAHQFDSDLMLFFYEKFGKQLNSLKGKVVWITGASSGIGEELAVQLTNCGAFVAISATRLDRLEQVKERCLSVNRKYTGKEVLVQQLDLTDFKSHQSAFDDVIKHFGRIDILVNNAGKYQVCHCEQSEIDVDVNYFGTINLTKIVVNHWLINNTEGHVAVTSSVAGLMSSPMAANYSATKFALTAWFEALRCETNYRKITVTVVSPGPVGTELFVAGSDGSVGGKMSEPTRKRFPFMTAERAAKLYTIALANSVREAWLVVPQILGGAYFASYLPVAFRAAMPWAMTANTLKKSITMSEFQ